MDSEAFFREPAREYQRLLTFLGLRPFEPATFDRHNGQPGRDITPPTRRMLTDYYAPHDERLAKLLGRPLGWAR
jgi:hypothetical protein